MKSFLTRNWVVLLLVVIAVLLAGIAWRQDGAGLVLAGVRSGGKIFLSVIPLLIAAFLIAGLIQTLVTQEFVTRWLGGQTGWKGILLGCVGGALIPGGPYVYYPIAAALLHAGAGLGSMVAFVTAKNLWSISRLPLEVALLGGHLTMVRFIATLLFPPLIGFLAEFLFGNRLESIRKAMEPS